MIKRGKTKSTKAEQYADILADMIDGRSDELARMLEPIRKFLLGKTKSTKAEQYADILADMIDGKDDDLAKMLEPIRKFLLAKTK